MVAAGKLCRCRPMVLRPYSSTGLPTALTNGGMSWLTRVMPPMNAYSPIRRELMHGDEAGDDDVVLHGDVPGELRAVGHDHAVADVTVVRQVNVRHDEAVAADRCDAATHWSPRLIVVNSRIRVPSPISTQVSSPAYLRSCGGPPRIEPVPTCTSRPSRTFCSSVARAAIRQPAPMVTSRADDGERADLDVVARSLADGSISAVGWMRCAHRSIIRGHHFSASQTTWPSTKAWPRVRQVFPRTCTTSTSKRSWSPGKYRAAEAHAVERGEVDDLGLGIVEGRPSAACHRPGPSPRRSARPGMIGWPGK